ncbi:MAG: aspartyl-tRNA(Asn)/glutamyl-tRNA(Gln) amidotransferase subunit B [Salibacteraceae bacterium]|jgi:aspartyl-tRNA(Asn)/glutamyl-tRNA(Gln) amidotransferase subunit B
MDNAIRDKYTAVIGLEIHAQLNTNSKAFSSDQNQYGSTPNSNVSPISLGHPGTLPRLNEKSFEYGIKLGLACDSDITRYNEFSRKNYFYADLPKGYQITQFDTPICTGGSVRIRLEDGSKKEIGLTRIHIEEDSGKSIHDIDPFNSLVDLNRAGVPLLEIVTEPEIASAEEAYEYLVEVRKLVRYLEVCDGNMEEGSMRCDANISVMLNGAKEFGEKVEVKNMNSIRNVKRAIEFEIERQIELCESSTIIASETRGFDATNGTTIQMRGKEGVNDYRFFPEPDLLPYVVTDEKIASVRESMPTLPNELLETYTNTYGLSEYDALNIIDSKEIGQYYNQVVQLTTHYKAAANWIMGEVKSHLNKLGISISEFQITPSQIAEIIELIRSNKISNSIASQKLFPALLENPTSTAKSLAESLDLIQNSNQDDLANVIDSVFEGFPDEASRIKSGEMKLIGFFMGKIMKASGGKADPKITNKILMQKIKS